MTADAVGGVWTYCLELADALAPYDVKVHLAVMGPPPRPEQRAQLARSAVGELLERAYALEWMDDPWTDVDRAGAWLLELGASLRPDVVHLNGYVHAALPWRTPTVVVAHSDVVSWWRAVRGQRPPAGWATYVERVRAGLDAADAVVAPTRSVLRDLATSYGHHGGTVIPNCRRDDWTRTRVKEPLMLAAGRMWDEAKNVRLLDTVAGDVRWPVVVAGAEPDRSPPGGGADGVVRLGRLDFEALADWMLRAAVFVAPATYEPFGLAPLEAAQAGCALVLGDIPSLREVWDDAALYVDPRDEQSLRRTLRELSDDPNRVDDLGRRARRRAERYTPAATAAAYAGLYRRLAARMVSA